MSTIARREAVGWLQTRGTSLRRACRVVGLSTATWRYERRIDATIVGDFPINDATRVQLETALNAIDFRDYFERDPHVVIAALNVVGLQARHLTSDTRNTLKTRILKFGLTVGNSSERADVRDKVADLIAAALIGCIWSNADASAKSEELAQAFEQLGEAHSLVFRRSATFILRLCDALPLKQARHFWKARDLLRCYGQ